MSVIRAGNQAKSCLVIRQGKKTAQTRSRTALSTAGRVCNLQEGSVTCRKGLYAAGRVYIPAEKPRRAAGRVCMPAGKPRRVAGRVCNLQESLVGLQGRVCNLQESLVRLQEGFVNT